MKEQIEICLDALKSNPNDRQAYETLAEIFAQAGRWKALFALNEKHSNVANWERLLKQLITAAQGESDNKESSEYFRMCALICENHVGRKDLAIKFYQKSVATWNLNAMAFDDARKLYLKEKDYQTFLRTIQVELGCNLSNARRGVVYHQLACFCQVLGQTEKYDEYENKAKEFAALAKQEEAEATATTDEKAEETTTTEEKAEETADTEEKAEETATVEEEAEETATAEEKAEETTTTEEKAEETTTVEEKAEETTTTEEKAEETADTEEKAEETADTEEKAEETATTEEKAEETATTEEKAEETADTEEKAEETATVEEEAEETATAEEKAEETTTTEEKAEETTTVEEKAEETTTTEEKAEETADTEEKAEETADTEEKVEETATTDEKAEETATTEEKAEETADTEEKAEETADTEEKAEETATTEEKAEETATTEEKAEETATTEEKAEETATVEEKVEETATAEENEPSLHSIDECCETIYRHALTGKSEDIGAIAAKACDMATTMEEAEPLFDALEEIAAYDVLAIVLATMSDKVSSDPDKRWLKADYADIIDLHLDKREEALDIATPISEGEDRAAYKARAVLAGSDKDKLEELAVSMTELLKKLRRKPEEMPLMHDLADLYVNRMGSMKDAEEQYKRIKLADPKNYKMLQFYCKYYESTGDWQRALSSLQTLKGAVSGSYRELEVSRKIAYISEEKLNNPGKAVNVWNQLLKDKLFIDEAREELIGLYTRTQKWQALLEIYKNDLEEIPENDTQARIACLKKSIDIYNDKLHLDAMVIKFYHQILTIDPDNEEAVNELISRYEASKRWNDLLKLLNQKAESATDPQTRVDIYYRISNLWSDSLGNIAKSIDPLLKIVEIDPTQKKALCQLHDFYEQRNSWANLYDIITKEADITEGAEKITLLKRQAEIGEANLHSAEKAIQSWEAISRVLEEPAEALEELKRLYKKQNDYQALLGVYTRALDYCRSNSDKIENLNAIVQLYLTKLDARAKAIETLKAMLDIKDGRDDALNQLTQLHVQAQEWDELVALYIDLDKAHELYELLDLTAADADDDDTQIKLYNTMANIAENQLHDDDLTVSAYEKILDVDSTNEETAQKLLKFYRAQGNHAKAIDAIQIIIAWTNDPDEKIAMLVEIANLYENELADVDHAANWYAKAVVLAPNRNELRTHFEALAAQNETPELIYDTYKTLINAENLNDDARIEIHRSFAKVSQKLDKIQEATSSWEVVRSADAADREALDALNDLYEQSCDWQKLLEIIDAKLERAQSDDETKTLSFKRAELLVSQIQNLDEAEKSYCKVLELDSENIDALHGLKGIYDATENWQKLADVLDRERQLVVEDRLNITYEFAEVERLHLDNIDGAIEQYAAILDEDPTHERTIATLESLIQDQVQTNRIAKILEPVYEHAGETEKQCGVLEIQCKSLDEHDQIPVLWQIYTLRCDVLNDKPASFEVAARLFKGAPDDERVWDNLENLATEIGAQEQWQEISNLYAQIPADTDHDDTWRYSLLRRRALVVEEKLNDPADCLPLWENIRQHEPENIEAIQHLEKLYKDAGAYENLVKLYEFEAQLPELSDDKRIEIQLEVALIDEDILSRPTDAIRTYRAILDIDATQADAVAALERLYGACALWSDLAALFEDELTIYTDADKLNQIRCNLANVYETHLANYEGAVDCYRNVIDNVRDDDVLQKANALLVKLSSMDESVVEQRMALCELLEPVYVEKNQLENLIGVLRIKLSDCSDDYDRVELNRRIANILRDNLNDDQGAFDALKGALRIDITDENIRSDFEALAFKLDAPKDIIDLYTESLEKVDDDVLKHALYQRVANVYEEKLNDTDNAIKAYRAMIELDEMDRASLDALENLYTNNQNWVELLDILRRKSEICDGDEKVDILRKMATINRDCLEHPKDAIENYREILDNVSDDQNAIEALDTLYTQIEDWKNLVDIYNIKLQLSQTDDEKREILKKMAEIQENNLHNAEEAIQLYTQILDIFPDDETTLLPLDRLYLASENYDDLATILQRLLALHENDEKTDELEYRLGQIYQNKLDSVEQAIDYYRNILARNPVHQGANNALSQLLDDDDVKITAARVLESVYAQTDQFENLAKVLEIQLTDEFDPDTQVSLLTRIADIHQNKLENYTAAFKDYARILNIKQESQYVEQLENLSEILNNTAELVDVYAQVVEHIYEPEAQIAFNNKIADLSANRLNDEKRAEEFYKATLEIQNHNEHALNALDEIYTKHEAWDDLLAILDAKLNAADADDVKLPILYRTAKIQELNCNNADDAIATYQRIVEINYSEQNAKDELARIYEQQEMWTELSDLIRSEIDHASDQDEKLSFKFTLAKLQNEKLHDDYDAIQTLKDILSDQPQNENARQYLENLFENGVNTSEIAEILEPIYTANNEWNKLIHSLEVRAKLEDDEFSQIEILKNIAKTWLENLDNPSKALETYGRIFIIQPADADIRTQIESLASQTLDLQVWADLYTKALQGDKLDDYQDKRLVMIALAKLSAERLNDHDKARELCHQMIEENAEEYVAYDILEWSFAQKHDYNALLDLWTKKADVVQDTDEKIALLQKIAQIQEDVTHDEVAACQTYQQIIDFEPNTPHAAAILERLLNKTEQFQKLADFYQQQSDYASNDRERVECMRKLALVRHQKLHDDEQAAEILGNALNIDPASNACKRTLETILNETDDTSENAEIRHHIAAILEPIYNDKDEWAKLANVLNVLIQTDDDQTSKVDLYMRLAALYEAHPSHIKRAFDAYADAFVCMPENTDARAKLEELSGALVNHTQLVDVYTKAINHSENDVDKMSFYERVAQICADNLHDDARAAQNYEAVLQLDEFNLNAIVALEKLYEKMQQFEKNVEILKRHVDIASNMFDQKDILYRIADIQSKQLHHLDHAIAAYIDVLDRDPEDSIALDALENLYKTTENWNELINIYKQKIDIVSDSTQKIQLNINAAEVSLDKLDDVDAAIEFYNQALLEDQNHIGALVALENIYSKNNRIDDLIENIQTQITLDATNGDNGKKHIDQIKLAHIYIEKADNHAAAIDVLKSILDENANATDAVDILKQLLNEDDLVNDIADILLPIFKNKEDFDAYVQICERKLQVTTDDFDKRTLYIDAANVADQKLNDYDKAFAFISAALQAAPADDELLRIAENLVSHYQKYSDLTDLCEKLIADSDDSDAIVKMAAIAAKYFEQYLNNIDKTVEQYERILSIDELNDDALRNLHRLYQITKNNEKLAQILEKLIDNNEQPINDLRFELFSLKRDDDPDNAFELLKQIVWDDAKNDQAYAAMEELLSHENLVNDIADILEPVYRDRNENEKLPALIHAKIRVAQDPDDKLALLKQLSNIQRDTIHDDNAAFNTALQALDVAPDDEEILNLICELGEKLNRYDDLALACQKAIDASNDDQKKIELMAKLAKIFTDHIGDDNHAIQTLQNLLAIDPDCLDALKHLDEIYSKQNDFARLLDVKSKQSELTYEIDAQKQLLFQCADLALNQLGDKKQATAFFEKIVELDDANLDAINPLLSLYKECGDVQKYVDLLNTKLLALNDDDQKYDIYLAIADAANEKLNDPVAAIDAYRSALDIRKSNDVYDQLENLYRSREAFQDLDDLLLSRLDETNDPAQKAVIRVKRAAIAEQHFNDDLSAIDLLKDALSDNPADKNAFNALDRIYSKNGDYQELYNLLQSQKNDASDENLITLLNVRIAKLAAAHLDDAQTAIDALNEVIEKQPDNIDAIDSLIEIYEQQKSYDLAINTLQKKNAVLKTDEDRADLYCHLAEVIHNANWNVEQIESAYRTALNFNPKNETAINALMDIAKTKQDTAKIIELLNLKADNAGSNDEKVKILSQVVEIAEQTDGFNENAADALDKMYRLDTDNIDIAQKLVDAYIKANRTDDAKPVLDGIIQKLSDSKQNKQLPPFYCLKGKLLKQNGDIAAAKEAFEAANAIDKNNVVNNLELGILLYETENYDAAIKIMQTLLLQQMNIKDKSTKIQIFYYLGMLRVKMNDPKRAKDMFSRALSVDPNHEPSKAAMAQL